MQDESASRIDVFDEPTVLQKDQPEQGSMEEDQK
jgi:hypothetical protein